MKRKMVAVSRRLVVMSKPLVDTPLAKAVWQKRSVNGFTLRAAADDAGVDYQVIFRAETRSTLVDTPSFLALAEWLGHDVTSLKRLAGL